MPTVALPKLVAGKNLTKRVAAKKKGVSAAQPSRAQQLVAAVRAMPIEDVRNRIQSARDLSDDELLARQAIERRQRSVGAAERVRAL
jgi:hypothetical protein